jgi:hypothetical protein
MPYVPPGQVAIQCREHCRAQRRACEEAAMTRVRLASTMIASAGYDAPTRILEIEFLSGIVYRYSDVPIDVYSALLVAPSHGRLFHARIRNAFRCHRAEVTEK